MTLAVGDKVRVLETRYDGDSMHVGQVTTVKKLGFDESCVFLEGVRGAVYKGRLEKVEEPALKVGDRVRVKSRRLTPQGDIGVVVKHRGGDIWDVKGEGWTGHGSSVTPGANTYSGHNLAKIEEPEPKFKVGDRVRLAHEHYFCDSEFGKGWVYHEAPNGIGSTATVISTTDTSRKGESIRVKWDEGGSSVIANLSLEKFEPVPFRLEYGDKVVNRKTGRVGRVLLGPVSKELKVYDETPNIQAPDAPAARALEEYEEHFPGSYDLFKAKDNPWQ